MDTLVLGFDYNTFENSKGLFCQYPLTKSFKMWLCLNSVENRESETDSHSPKVWCISQGCHFPDNMKFPNFSRPRLSSTASPRPFRGVGGMLPQKTSKIRIFNLAENEFQTTKFPDFSLTFGILSQIP